ncbi:MAG: hypothetical protein L0220_26160 [Acidobacteria bacterium]|nr:hypothetical protein [Acidobacteriota bacterium]
MPKATRQSVLRAILQSIEVALLNIADLLARATENARCRDFGPATVKLSWARDFHYILTQLSVTPIQTSIAPAAGEERRLSISDSPAFQEFAGKIRDFDDCVRQILDLEIGLLKNAIAQHSTSDAFANLIHLARICNHEATVWEHNLAAVSVPGEAVDYRSFVVADRIRDMVYDRALKGDTFFTAFRAVHQIPEILTAEVNNFIEQAICRIREGSVRWAYKFIAAANALLNCVLAAATPIVNNLTTVDYHQIRENLGMTSGSQSAGIHYHLFKDLSEQIAEEFYDLVMRNYATSDVFDALKRADSEHLEDETAFSFHIFGDELLKLRAFLFRWRDAHMHLPRNALGGNFTRSLIGSPDAVKAVKCMRQTAFEQHPLQKLAEARRLSAVDYSAPELQLTRYFASGQSLDALILDTTGEVTKMHFMSVQERTGVFAAKKTFHSPGKS